MSLTAAKPDSQMEFADGRTALYRLYDADDDLLYVGITSEPHIRFARHARSKRWWPDVAQKVLEWYDSRKLADAAETKAIAEEKPRYNVAKAVAPVMPWHPPSEEQLAAERELGAAVNRMYAIIEDYAARGDLMTAYKYADHLVKTLCAATNEMAAIRAEIACRIRDKRGMSLGHLGIYLGISKARAAEMVGKAKERQRRAEEAAAG